MLNLLSVPVVDLVDVPEDDFVFSFHVVGDALFLDPLHEALQGRRRSAGCSHIQTHIIYVVVTWCNDNHLRLNIN